MRCHIAVAAMRAIAALSLGAALVGCSNRVVSDEPWFTHDEASAPRLRPGLWIDRSADCRVDESQPSERWPECAQYFVVREHDVLDLDWTGGARDRSYEWSSAAYVLAPGDPLIQQVTPCTALGLAPAFASPPGDAPPSRSTDTPPPRLDPRAYCYSAMRPTRFDSAGRIVSFEAWPVYCGPWPTEEEAERSGGNVTLAPFPGLHVVYENCTAENEEALRMAARASEAMTGSGVPGRVSAHWVRDGYH